MIPLKVFFINISPQPLSGWLNYELKSFLFYKQSFTIIEMEELTAQLAGSFDVSHAPNKTAAPHPRYAQYKMRSTKNDQESRRTKLLEVQRG